MARQSWDHGGRTRQQRGYGAAWEKLRQVILQRDRYLCQPCIRSGRPTQAAAVDHIKAKAKGGTDDLENLEAICSPCHTAKSIRDQGKKPRLKRRVTYGEDGWPIEDGQ